MKPFKVPAPDAYNPNATFTQKSAAKWGFGSEQRTDPAKQNGKSISPGPGNYRLEPMAFEKRPRFFMGTKLNPLKGNMEVPGAGTYQPEPEKVLKSAPKITMKVKLTS